MRFLLIAMGCLMALAVSGCATFSRGTVGTVTFVSEPSQLKVTTSNGLFCVTPCTLDVDKSQTFTARFEGPGGAVKEVFVDTRVSDAVWGTTAANVLFSPIVTIPAAIAVDAASGANLTHTPNPVKVVFDDSD